AGRPGPAPRRPGRVGGGTETGRVAGHRRRRPRPPGRRVGPDPPGPSDHLIGPGHRRAGGAPPAGGARRGARPRGRDRLRLRRAPPPPRRPPPRRAAGGGVVLGLRPAVDRRPVVARPAVLATPRPARGAGIE